jgi:hypothetical protein
MDENVKVSFDFLCGSERNLSNYWLKDPLHLYFTVKHAQCNR